MTSMFLLLFSGLVCGGVSVGAVQQEKQNAQELRQARIDSYVKAAKPRRYKLEQAPYVQIEKIGYRYENKTNRL